MKLVVVSGLSGAGKTTARFALEDAGYYAVDNLPPPLWPGFLSALREKGIDRAALVVDVRARAWFQELKERLAELKELAEVVFIFLEARPEVLVGRYNLTRRAHPLGPGQLAEELAREREELGELRELADFVLDTSEITARELKEKVLALVGEELGFLLRLISFGFRYGPPQDVDLVLDARGFPNPYYDERLKERPGTEPLVREYVFPQESEDRYRAMLSLVGLSAEAARAEGRRGYQVAVGCTGGFHRSVAVVERLAEDLAGRFRIEVWHRDLEKAKG